MRKYIFFPILFFVKIGFTQGDISSLKTNLNVNSGKTQAVSISVITPINGGGTRTDTRTFRFHLPNESPDCNLTVLMAFHGDGGTGAGIETSTGFSTFADTQNFIAVYPDKLSGQSHFSYRIDAPSYLNGQIDSTFMLAIIDYLYQNYGINKNRVYGTGISSGAAFVYFLTAKLPNSFAAFAPVAGYPQDYSSSSHIWINSIASSSTPKMPILHIHGTADNVGGTEYYRTSLPNPYPTTPINQNNGWIWPMFPLSNKSCTNAPGNYTASYFQSGNTTVDKLIFCSGGALNKEVSMLIVRGMGHSWPNSVNTNGVDGSLAIWNFVKDYQLNTATTISPTISPPSITINSGASTVLTASGCGSLDYLWSSGQTSASISISPINTTNYTVSCKSIISNCQVGAVSNIAIISVKNPCLDSINLTATNYPTYNSNKLVQAAEYITTISPPEILISYNDSLTLQAGKSIMFNAGFSSQLGAIFSAKIGDCSSFNFTAYLKVNGINIKNKCGTNLIIRGVNFTGYFQYDINNPTQCLDKINQIKLAGANTVRLPWLTSTQYGRDYKVLDTLLKNITDQKMIVMVELHDFTCAPLTVVNIQAATNYWLSPNVLAVLKKYENYLLLNMANEVGNDWQGNTATVRQKLIDAYSPAITALRNAGLKCPFVIDAPDCGQNIEALVEAAPALLASDPDHNIVFSAHTYWNNDNYTARLTDAATIAASEGICLIIGEFSVSQDCPLNATSNDYMAVLQVCNLFNLGYLAWEWGGSRQYGGKGNICPDDSRGVGYSRLTMSGSTGLNADVAGWGITVRTDILATSVESCQFN